MPELRRCKPKEAVLTMPTCIAPAGTPVRVVGEVPMGNGRRWLAVEAQANGATYAVPPEGIRAPEAPQATPAQQLSLEGAEIMVDTLSRPEAPDTPDPTDSPEEYSAPNTRRFLEVPVALVTPHPDNIRTRFDTEGLDELAADIRSHGILEPLLVQTAPVSCTRCAGKGVDEEALVNKWRDSDQAPFPCVTCDGSGQVEGYRVIAGERRLRAAKQAGLETVPVIIRDDLSEADVVAIMLSENMKRANLNPMEIAEGFSRLSQHLKQTEIAERFGISQPSVANTLALLRLPESVRTRIAEGQLSASHGRLLVKWAKWPEYCELVAKRCAEGGWSTSVLERGNLPVDYQAEAAHLLLRLGYSTPFDWRETCTHCPHEAFLQVHSDIGACFRPECYSEQVQQADTRKREKLRQVTEAARAAGARLPENVPAPAADTPEGAAEGTTPAPAEAESPLARLEDLPLDSHIRFGEWVGNTRTKPFPQCEGCVSFLTGLFHGNECQCCFEPTCLRRLVKEAAAQAEKEQTAALTQVTDAAAARIDAALEDPEERRRLLVPLVCQRLVSAPVQLLRKIFGVMDIAWDPRLFDNSHWARPVTDYEGYTILSELPESRLVTLIARLMLAEDYNNGKQSTYYTMPAARWWAGLPDPDQAKLQQSYRHCGAEIRPEWDAVRAAAGLPALQLPDPPEAPHPPTRAEAAGIPETYTCAGCDAALDPDQVADFMDAADAGAGVLDSEEQGLALHIPTGLAWGDGGLLYCPTCAETLNPDLWAARETHLARLAPEADAVPAETLPGEEVAPEDEAYTCLRCDEPIDGRDVQLILSAAATEGGPIVHMADGHLVARGRLIYCPECAPNVQVCRKCGCTDEAACEGGCAWVEPDLCSACADEVPPESVVAWERLTPAQRLTIFDAEGAAFATASGAVVTKTGAWFCEGCAGTVRICRICGESEFDRPSLKDDGGWAEDDLCQVCADFEAAPEA